MKILLINDYGFPEGGVESYIESLKKILEKKGHKVKIFTSNSHPELRHFNDYEYQFINTKSIFRFIPYIFNINSYFSLKKVLKEFKPDVIHLHYIFYHTSPSVLLLLKDIPTIMTLHAHEIIAPMGITINKMCKHSIIGYCPICVGIPNYIIEKFKRFIFHILSNNIDIYITPSNYYMDLHERYGLTNIQKVFNGINLFNYYKLYNDHCIVYAGRLTPGKGVQVLIKSIPLILKIVPDLKVYIIGSGPYYKELFLMAKNLRITNSVYFINKVERQELSTYYRKANVVIIPSIWTETFGLVGVEAMSTGRPVIGSRIGGIPEWLDDGKTGFLVDPGNSEQIAEKVIQLLSDRNLLEQMGKNARRKAKQFSIEKHVVEMEKVYTRVIEKYKI